MKRLFFLDIYRGIMILWVLIVHISLNAHYISYGTPNGHFNLFTLLSFYMFTFYFAAGYLFKSGRTYKELLTRKVRSLAVPWVLYTIFGIIIYLGYCFFTKESITIKWSGIFKSWSLSTNTPMWFLGSLFFATNLMWLFANKMTLLAQIIGDAIFVAILVIIPNKHLWFGFENIILGTVVMNLGYLYKKYEQVINTKRIFSFASILFITIWVFCPSEYWFGRNVASQGTFLTGFFYGILGSYLLFKIAKTVQTQNVIYKSLSFIGKNSLILFAFHRPILNYIIEPTLLYYYPKISYIPFLFASLFLLFFLYILFFYFAKRFCTFLL